MEPGLRIRLEGADEVLDAYAAVCERLRKLLGRGWRAPLRNSTVAVQFAEAQAGVSRARSSCAALGQHREVQALLARVQAAERSLEASADKALARCGDTRGGTLHEKVDRLVLLAQPLVLESGERVLMQRKVSGGLLTMTQSRELVETDDRCGALAPDDPLLRSPLPGLLSRLRRELNLSGAPLVEPGPFTVVEVFRFAADDRGSSPGLLLCWHGGLLFLAHDRSERLPAALFGDEQPVQVTDSQLLETLGLVLPWAEPEIRRRLDVAGLDWCWARSELSIDGPDIWRVGRRLPAYRVIQGLEDLQRCLSPRRGPASSAGKSLPPRGLDL